MESTENITWSLSLERVAKQFEYPPTPDLVTAMRVPQEPRRTEEFRPRAAAGRRLSAGSRLAWAVVILALIFAGLLAVPQTRAAVLLLFDRIGAIRIFVDETAPTAVPTVEEQSLVSPIPPAADAAPERPNDHTAHSLALFELGEAASFDEAQAAVDFPLIVPPNLGRPHEIYIHQASPVPPAVTLVWRGDDGAPFSLTEIAAPEFASKMIHDQGVKSLRVGDRPAVWLTGPHRLQLLGNWQESGLLIESNVLIWSAGGVTYRLEGDRSEAEMVAIAESMSGE